ncbi:hypothetical protein [Thioalkalivibrio sulfidiphilus]|uniref:Uncharacterized protein n=1 Tax=Thioalkalivibrio sulfidiphilus (strain HL-EbGR7) TaxID=396588 RepID=B8GNE4_THISH|nr:hypothetical protein [Thioalkalivibrio sulfidiphilus]ACL73835.1 hypothetical protein Tgr7_2761 [Thioalkalivibrio sulfidiphilus HL-EbGr7]
MPVRSLFAALLLALFLSAPALADAPAESQEITGPVINQDFCPG